MKRNETIWSEIKQIEANLMDERNEMKQFESKWNKLNKFEGWMNQNDAIWCEMKQIEANLKNEWSEMKQFLTKRNKLKQI